MNYRPKSEIVYNGFFLGPFFSLKKVGKILDQNNIQCKSLSNYTNKSPYKGSRDGICSMFCLRINVYIFLMQCLTFDNTIIRLLFLISYSSLTVPPKTSTYSLIHDLWFGWFGDFFHDKGPWDFPVIHICMALLVFGISVIKTIGESSIPSGTSLSINPCTCNQDFNWSKKSVCKDLGVPYYSVQEIQRSWKRYNDSKMSLCSQDASDMLIGFLHP